MITGKENLVQIAEMDDPIMEFLNKNGLGKYFMPDHLKKIGRFTRLETVLKSNKIDVDSFVESLNRFEQAGKSDPELLPAESLHFVAMLPCGLRNPFKEHSESFFEQKEDEFGYLNYLIEGNVNHELSYYPLLESINDVSELPDIIMASDINNFFHRPFVDKFISTNHFEACTPYIFNSYLEKEGYSDPDNNYTMYTANMLVMVVDKEKLGDRKVPEVWSDLLKPEFENDIIMRGEDDFFCNAVMLPFYKDKGMDAIKILARNIKSGMHPAEMVKLVGSGKKEGAAIYIMPWFFSKRIKGDKADVVWPQDGAIASPVFLLIKRGKAMQHMALLEYLFSKETGQLINSRFFPGVHPDVANDSFPDMVKWLGWDFLKSHDIGKLKDEIREAFLKVWETKSLNI
ncbi:ABC transporter substrate-binding protein [Plebeiibacterium marinum]|uniref:ABC transporter substrate-binding protein n=1 Tax=Plebeiibacterium marinum TaxID=2992111 RepID=A0AAE3SJX3_9BACT|nr:ABC transporter substrate-binding protein [Plebeiobacterium marinum]MCW3806017.1 ABC transporter substrate-binding protein [Plebeiobacterium marinum]